VVNVTTDCGDVPTPLHLQAGLHYTGVVMYMKLTTTIDACTTLVVYKKHKLGLYVHATCNYTTMAKVYLTPPQVKLRENIQYIAV